MVAQIPVEACEYSVADAIRGLVEACRRSGSDETLDIFGLNDCIPVRSARAGIIIAIKALGLQPGASIAVPLYCCPVVLKALMYAGCRPLFVDIDPSTYCMSADDLSAKARRVDAAIVVHMFGNTCDMSNVRAVMNGKPIIEDCAQALGSSVDGRTVGAGADVAVFSFRSGKYISAGEGGALYSSDERLRADIGRVVSELPACSLANEIKHVLTVYIRSKLRAKPLWGLLGQRVWAVYTGHVDFLKQSPIAVTRPFRSDLALAKRRMRSLGPLVEAQRANALHYLRTLHVDASACVREPQGSYYNRYSFPVRCESRPDRDRLRGHLRGRHISASTPYSELLLEAPRHYGYRGDCPRSEEAFERTLVIPSNYTLRRRDRDRIVRSVNEVFSRNVSPCTEREGVIDE